MLKIYSEMTFFFGNKAQSSLNTVISAINIKRIKQKRTNKQPQVTKKKTSPSIVEVINYSGNMRRRG